MTEKLKLAISQKRLECGIKLNKMHELHNAGTDLASPEMMELIRDLKDLNGILNGLVFAAKELLCQKDYLSLLHSTDVGPEEESGCLQGVKFTEDEELLDLLKNKIRINEETTQGICE